MCIFMRAYKNLMDAFILYTKARRAVLTQTILVQIAEILVFSTEVVKFFSLVTRLNN